MRARFYNAPSKPVRPQGISRNRARTQLSTEARGEVNTRRREAQQQYRKAIDEAWAKIDEFTQGIAANHHKSLRRVQGELHMGRTLARIKRKKSNAWNAFLWKKNCILKDTERK
jgi:hypothetical protein